MKKEIISKAAEKFLNLGVKSVTMDEISMELGISKKTLYTYFSTKTNLVEATAFHVFEEISRGIGEIRKREKDPVEEMYEIKNFACKHLRDEKSSPQFQLQKYYPQIYSSIRMKQQKLLEDHIKDNLVKGIAKGVYRSTVPVEFTSRIYFIGVLGIKDNDLFPDSQTPKKLIEQHLEYHLRAIVTDEGLRTLEKLMKKND